MFANNKSPSKLAGLTWLTEEVQQNCRKIIAGNEKKNAGNEYKNCRKWSAFCWKWNAATFISFQYFTVNANSYFFYSMTSMVVNIWQMIRPSLFHLIEYYYKMFVTQTDNWDKLIYLARCKQICMICYDYTYLQIIKSECESQTQYICDCLPIKVVPYTKFDPRV